MMKKLQVFFLDFCISNIFYEISNYESNTVVYNIKKQQSVREDIFPICKQMND